MLFQKKYQRAKAKFLVLPTWCLMKNQQANIFLVMLGIKQGVYMCHETIAVFKEYNLKRHHNKA